MENTLLEISPILMYFKDNIGRITFLFGFFSLISLILTIRFGFVYYNITNKYAEIDNLPSISANTLNILDNIISNLEENTKLKHKVNNYDEVINKLDEFRDYVHNLNKNHLYLKNLEKITIFLSFLTVILFLTTLLLPSSHTLTSIFINSNNEIVDANLLQYFMLSIEQMVKTIH